MIDEALLEFRAAVQLDPSQKLAQDGISRMQKAQKLKQKSNEADSRPAPASSHVNEDLLSHETKKPATAAAASAAPAAPKINVHEMTLDDILNMGGPASSAAGHAPQADGPKPTLDPNFKSEQLDRLRERQEAERQEEEQKDAVSDLVNARVRQKQRRTNERIAYCAHCFWAIFSIFSLLPGAETRTPMFARSLLRSTQSCGPRSVGQRSA